MRASQHSKLQLTPVVKQFCGVVRTFYGSYPVAQNLHVPVHINSTMYVYTINQHNITCDVVFVLVDVHVHVRTCWSVWLAHGWVYHVHQITTSLVAVAILPAGTCSYIQALFCTNLYVCLVGLMWSL